MRFQHRFPSEPTADQCTVDQLYRLADDVRRIGTRRGSTPFDLLADKEAAADRLVDLARRLETAR